MSHPTRLPTPGEINELAAFLPKLYAEGFIPVKHWEGGKQNGERIATFPWPEYEDVVLEFFQVAANEWWCDYKYHPGRARQMLEDGESVKTASLPQIKTLLTYCVRGERFCDGHWAVMIERGYIRTILERLAEFGSQISE